MLSSEFQYSCEICGKEITKDEWSMYGGKCFQCYLKSKRNLKQDNR